VQILEEGQPYLRPLEVSTYERVAGRPYFLHWRSVDLEFDVIEPPAYKAVYKRLAPWTGIYLKVPGDFTKKEFRVLRVVPLSQFNTLPTVDNPPPDVAYSLKLSRGGQCGSTATGIESFTVKDLRRQSLYVGSSESEVKWLIQNRDNQKFHDEFINALARNNVPVDKRSEWMREWEARPRVVPDLKFQEKDLVCIQIFQAGVHDPLQQTFIPKLTFEENIRSEYLDGAQ
jgi:hypothetical protein